MPSDEERVPSLDAEACARLLDDLIVMLAPHDAQSIADANQLRALKLALPGMGKDSERYRFVKRYLRVETDDGSMSEFLFMDDALCSEDTVAEGFDNTVDSLIDQAIAARAAQPEEAPTCTGVAARWCPIHGDCTGVPDEQIPTAPYSDHCSDRDCPLHGTRSMHAAGNLSG